MLNRKEPKVKNIVHTVVKGILDQETYDWPPKCTAILYQPTRPQNFREIQKSALTEENCINIKP